VEKAAKKKRRKPKKKKSKKTAVPGEENFVEDAEEDDDDDGFDELLGRSSTTSPIRVTAESTDNLVRPSKDPNGKQVSAQALAQLRATQYIDGAEGQLGGSQGTDDIIQRAVGYGYDAGLVERTISDMFSKSEAYDDFDAVLERLRNTPDAENAPPAAPQASLASSQVAFTVEAPGLGKATAAEATAVAPATPGSSATPANPTTPSAATNNTTPRRRAASSSTGLERVATPHANLTPVAVPDFGPSSNRKLDPDSIAKVQERLGRALAANLQILDLVLVVKALFDRSPLQVALALINGASLQSVLKYAVQFFGENAGPGKLGSALLDLFTAMLQEIGGTANDRAAEVAGDLVQVLEAYGTSAVGLPADALDSFSLALCSMLRSYCLSLMMASRSKANKSAAEDVVDLPFPLSDSPVASGELLADTHALQKLFKERDEFRDRAALSLQRVQSTIRNVEMASLPTPPFATGSIDTFQRSLELELEEVREAKGAGEYSASDGVHSLRASQPIRNEVERLRNTLAADMQRMKDLQMELSELEARVQVTRQQLDARTSDLEQALELTGRPDRASAAEASSGALREKALQSALQGIVKLRQSFDMHDGDLTSSSSPLRTDGQKLLSSSMGVYLASLSVYARDSAKCIECLELLVDKDKGDLNQIKQEAEVYRSIGGLASMTADLDAKADALESSIAKNSESISFLKRDMQDVIGGIPLVHSFVVERCRSVADPRLMKQISALGLIAGSAAGFDADRQVDEMVVALEAIVSQLNLSGDRLGYE